MKKLFLLLMSFTFVLYSCETTDLENSDNLSIDFAKIESLKKMNESSQRVAFKLLNTREKHAFRVGFIDEYIQNNELSDERLSLLNELKANFSHKIYENADYAQYFKNIFINSWLEKSKNYFTIDELYPFVAAPYISKKITSDNSSETERFGGDCSCHQGGTFWCTKQREVQYSITDPSVTTTSVPCDQSNGCQTPGEINDDGYWVEDTGGCGWFWMERCDGGC